ncbi:MAG: hypothetical protein HYV63_03415 [Candidatus Schekmanbacteria bacterium]|nr:hypothetical protein [Candidatus Schekmanbacteria bacterium]
MVARKRPHPSFAASPRILDRFRKEATTLAALDSPNVVGVIDQFREDGHKIEGEYIVGGQVSFASLARCSDGTST